VIIGDEVLSAKVVDANTPYLITRLSTHGIALESVAIVPDDPAIIAEAVRTASARHDHVITSGGVGPTHDDVTVDSVAGAFEEDVHLHDEFLQRLRSFRPDRHQDALERIARVPQSATLLWGEDLFWPVIRVRNVSLLPGVPKLFARCLEVVLADFEGSLLICHRIELTCSEADILEPLDAVVRAHPDVTLGSYPRYDDTPWRVQITLESDDAARVNAATDHLTRLLNPDDIHAIHRPTTFG
jgi:molybdenum cofactor synthesis domain-containing protein